MKKLSVIVIAKNESANIARCLASVRFADEIIVLDSGSSDDTVDIARRYTELVYETDWQGYGIQKQRALSHASGEWVLNLDADEHVSEELRQDIIRAVNQKNFDGFRVPIRMQFYGRAMKYSSSPSRHIRLFRREGARFSDDIVHEKIIMPARAKISQFKNAIFHHSYQDVSHALYKINKYSSYTAKIRLKSARFKKPSMLKALISAGWMFSRCFFLQRGFLDGEAGFLFAMFNAQSSFYRAIKQMYPDRGFIEKLPEPGFSRENNGDNENKTRS